jgi:hypothetical protein
MLCMTEYSLQVSRFLSLHDPLPLNILLVLNLHVINSSPLYGLMIFGVDLQTLLIFKGGSLYELQKYVLISNLTSHVWIMM